MWDYPCVLLTTFANPRGWLISDVMAEKRYQAGTDEIQRLLAIYMSDLWKVLWR